MLEMKYSPFLHSVQSLYKYILAIGKDFERFDILCDRYFEISLKEGVRKHRGAGTKLSFNESTKLSFNESTKLSFNESTKLSFNESTKFPSKFSDDFLKHSENKERLNLFLAQSFLKFHENNPQTFVVTFQGTILSNSVDLVNDKEINYCSSEEADLRWLRQVKNGYKNIVIKTVDRDVLILAVAYCPRLITYGVDRFVVEFDVVNRTQYYNIIEISW